MAAGIVRTLLRWILVPGSAAAILMGIFLAGRGVVTLADAHCVSDFMVGGACVEGWHTTAIELTIYGGVLLAALGLTIVPALLAPALARWISVLGFVLLLTLFALAYYVTRGSEFLPPMALAALAGAAGMFWIHSRSRRDASP